MILVLTFLKFAFGTCSYGICLESRHLVLGLQVHSTRVFVLEKLKQKTELLHKFHIIA